MASSYPAASSSYTEAAYDPYAASSYPASSSSYTAGGHGGGVQRLQPQEQQQQP